MTIKYLQDISQYMLVAVDSDKRKGKSSKLMVK